MNRRVHTTRAGFVCLFGWFIHRPGLAWGHAGAIYSGFPDQATFLRDMAKHSSWVEDLSVDIRLDEVASKLLDSIDQSVSFSSSSDISFNFLLNLSRVEFDLCGSQL